MGALAEKLLHWVLPLTCWHCAEDLPEGDRSPLCADCARAFAPPEGLLCARCSVPLKYGGERCWPCRHLTKPLPALRRLRMAALFGDEVRAVIHALKYESRAYLAPAVGDWLFEAWKRHPELHEAAALVPVPLHPARQAERGFNQAEELARRLAERTGVPLRPILTKVASTRTQADLSREDRLINVKDAFFAQRGAGLKGKAVVLIDDVATTGATLEECARALKKVGVKHVDALVVARQARPSG